MSTLCRHCGAPLRRPSDACCNGAVMAMLTPDDIAEAVAENPAAVYRAMGEKIDYDECRVRLFDGEDMPTLKAMFFLVHQVMVDPTASDALKTIAGDINEAHLAALRRYYRRRESDRHCMED